MAILLSYTVKICDLHGSWDDVGPRVKEIVREALRCGPMPASALAELHERAQRWFGCSTTQCP